jgi:hypothetical protein
VPNTDGCQTLILTTVDWGIARTHGWFTPTILGVQSGKDTPSTSAKDCPGQAQELKTEWDAYQITFSNSHGGGVAPYFNPYIVAVPGQKFDVQCVPALSTATLHL